jgi:hypothetical protein
MGSVSVKSAELAHVRIARKQSMTGNAEMMTMKKKMRSRYCN